MHKTLTAVAIFTLIASCWLTVMNVVLHHAGYQWQAAVSALLMAQSALTLAVMSPGAAARTRGRLRWLVTIGAAAVLYAGGAAVAEQLSRSAFDPARPGAPHFEGFALVIGVFFAIQGILTLFVLFPTRVPATL